MEELVEKECLVNCLQSLFDLFFGGVIVIDVYGVVCEVNLVVLGLFGELLVGMFWCEVIVCCFVLCEDDGYEIFLCDGCCLFIVICLLNGELG